MTPRQIELVKSTVPVLREHGVALTTHFYKRMLEGNPELRNVFNTAHQAKGEQQKALAMAVLAYAENIENPAVLMPAVKHIATKHCTIDIRPEQYAIVGRHLLASIREVLGEAASDELVDAWAAAYAQLAEILIGVESKIYAGHTARENAWSGWRPFKVIERREETPDTVSFELVPADGGGIPSYLPGQFISVRTFLKDRGIVQPRQYTLSRASGLKPSLRITVKRIDNGMDPEGAMSSHLHRYVHEGSILDVSAPTGDFVLEDKDTPVILIGAGSGMTPMAAMLGHLAQNTPQRPVEFIGCAPDMQHVILGMDIRENMAKLSQAKAHLFLSKSGEMSQCPVVKNGRLTQKALQELHLDTAADVYLCGPVTFMGKVKASLLTLGFASSQIHTEIFGTGMMP